MRKLVVNRPQARKSIASGIAGALCIVAVLLRPGPAEAAVDKIVLRGLDADKVYATGDADVVDTFTGNLMQRVPLGPELGTNGTLKYRFQLVYNSRAWDHIGHAANGRPSAVADIGDYSGKFATQTEISGVESIPAVGTNAGLGWTLTIGGFPKVAWDRANDRWYPRISWVSSDGSVHEFFRELHGPAAPNTMPEARQTDLSVPYFTRDGTYLRMRSVQAPDSQGREIREIDGPDGVTYRISCAVDCSPNAAYGQPEWYVDEIRDRFGSKLTFARSRDGQPHPNLPYPGAGGGAETPWTWTITQWDGVTSATPTRHHEIRFSVRRREGSTHNRMEEVEVLAQEVRLDLGAAAGPDGKASYRLEYVHPLLHMEMKNTWGHPSERFVPFAVRNGLGFVDAALLRRVRLPANEAGGVVEAGAWDFRYFGDKVETDEPGVQAYPDTVSSIASPQWGGAGFVYYTAVDTGLMVEANYPTGRGYRYDYMKRRFIRAGCLAERLRDLWESLPAVLHRRMTKRTTSPRREDVPGSTWTYFGWPFNAFDDDGDTDPRPVTSYACESIAREMMGAVVEPEGRTTVTFYSGYVTGAAADSTAGWKVEEFGLPTSRAEKSIPDVSGEGGGIPVSQHVYDCSGVDLESQPDSFVSAMRRLVKRNRRPGEVGPCGDLPLREVFVEYESTTKCDLTDGKECATGNPRVVRSKTVYNDVCDETGCRYEPPSPSVPPFQAERWTSTTNSGFDGLGHFRATRTQSNFPRFAFPQTGVNDDRTATTNYNPGVQYDAASQSVSWGSASWIQSTWLLETYDSITRSQVGGGSFRTTHVFDQTTGFLTQTRTEGQAPQPGDLRTTFTRSVDPDGSVVVESNHYGGDYTSAGSTQPEYTIRRRTWLGAPTSVAYVECNGQVVHAPYAAVVDPVAAVPTRETNGAGRTFDYAYDPLLRVRTVTPAQPGGVSGGKVTHVYPALTGAAELFVTTSQQGEGTDLKESATTANDVFESLSALPEGRDAVLRSRTRAKTRNVWGEAAALSSPRGWLRAERTMAPSEGESALTLYDYDVFGRVVRVTPPDSNQKVTHAYEGAVFDRTRWHGVALSSGDSVTKQLSFDGFGRIVKADEWGVDAKSYRYDAADHLVEVNGGGQTRSFAYDNRGLLVREQHPELATREYRYSYDSRGNSRRRLVRAKSASSQSATATFNVANGFEAFDQQYRYDGAERLIGVDLPADGSGLQPRPFKAFVFEPGAQGRLKNASRVNYVDDPTRLDRTREYGVDLTFGYDSVGRITSRTLRGGGLSASLAYEYDVLDAVTKVTYPGAGGGSGRQVSYDLENGSLRSISQPGLSFVSDVAYHANGFWSTISRDGRSTDTQSVKDDTTKMRPRPARIETPGRWDTGTISYDGAGNVRTANHDRYTYDEALRLTQANVKAGASTIALRYAYDVNGNMTSTTRDGVVTTFSSGAFPSNRLPGGEYDAGGNLTGWIDPRAAGMKLNLEFDAANMATRTWGNRADGSPSFGRVHLYDAFDERVAVIDYVSEAETIANPSPQSSIRERWSVRGASNELLSDFVAETDEQGIKTWRWDRDYVHGLGRVVAEVRARGGGGEDVLDLHWDHLGSVRCVTSGNGPCSPLRKYLPFGEEIAQRQSDDGRVRFTSHERDDDGTNGPFGDLDYMHARFFGVALGRFLSLDPVGGDAAKPQSWNRYAYVLNNPVSLTDPTGRCVWDVCVGEAIVVAAAATALTAWAVGPSPVESGKNNMQVAGAQLRDAGSAMSSSVRPNAEKARKLYQDWVESWYGTRPDVPRHTKEGPDGTEEPGSFWDICHICPRADAGNPADTDVGPNLIPMPKWEHIDWHKLQGDFVRWATEAAEKAKALGKGNGTAKPQPKPAEPSGSTPTEKK